MLQRSAGSLSTWPVLTIQRPAAIGAIVRFLNLPARHSVGENLIEQLADRSMGFADGCAVIGRPREFSVGKRDSAKRSRAEDFPRRRIAIFPEKETGLRADISVPPAVEHDTGDIPLWIKSGG